MQTSIIEWFTSFDAYGSPITPTLKGNDTYKTGLGGLVTLLSNGLLAVWLYFRVAKWYTKDDPDFFPYTVISDLDTVKDQVLKKNGFNFAIGLFDPIKAKWSKIEPEFGTFQIM